MSAKKYVAVIAIAVFVTSMLLMGAPRNPVTPSLNRNLEVFPQK